MKINRAQLRNLRRSSGMQAVIKKHTDKFHSAVEADFQATSQNYRNDPVEGYEASVEVNDDRVRGYVETKANQARRHEARSSSLLRVSARGGM